MEKKLVYTDFVIVNSLNYFSIEFGKNLIKLTWYTPSPRTTGIDFPIEKNSEWNLVEKHILWAPMAHLIKKLLVRCLTFKIPTRVIRKSINIAKWV